MKIRLKILTPVYIGSGDEISPIEYFIDNNKFIRLDMDELFQDKEFKPYIDEFVKEASLGNRYIGKIITDKNLLKKYPLYSINISPSAQAHLRTNPITVKTFIKSAGRAYIPGSSLKGAILSAVIFKKSNKINDYVMDDVIGKVSNRKSQNGFSRWLDVTDSNLKFPKEYIEISLARIEGARSDRSQPVLYETLVVGTTFELEMKTSIDSIDCFGKLSIKDILELTNEFYRKVYEKEKTYKKIKQSLPDISQNSILIRIGQGSTCLSTSLLLLAEKLNDHNYKIDRPRIKGRELQPIRPGETPWTRKLISENIPLGWAEATYV